ncbi:MAG: carboxypeptidase-like regulatory domain-containing protein [Bacteroidota bacterium]
MLWKLTLVLVTFGFQITTSDGQITIKGSVKDSIDLSTLPYVHITFGNARYGTTSNGNGDFLVRIPKDTQKDTLRFSYMGYATKVLPIEDLKTIDKVEVLLSPASIELGMVEIQSINALQLIDEAIKKIPDNYPNEAMLLTGFYREKVEQIPSKQVNLYAEGVLQVYKEDYTKRRIGKDEVKLLKGYREGVPYKYFVPDGHIDIPKITQGAFMPLILDFVKYNGSFISKKNLSRYRFFYESSTQIDGELVHQIRFEPKRNAVYQGELFIHDQTKAFVKAAYSYTPKSIQQFNFLNQRSKLQLLSRSFEIN